MNRLVSILLILMLAPVCRSAKPSFAERSVLSEGNFVKIRVAETGVYKLSFSELKSMGLKPADVCVYGYGGAMLNMVMSDPHIDDLPQVPVYMHNPSSAKSDNERYILFYAKGPVSWRYTGSRFMHTCNPYSNYGYYFLTDNAGEPALLEANHAVLDTLGAHHVTTFSDYQLHELDSLIVTDKNGEEGCGREWYGESFGNGTKYGITFNVPDIVASEMYCYIDVAATSSEVSRFYFGTAAQQSSVSVPKKSGESYIVATVAYMGAAFPADNNEKQTISVLYESENSTAIGYLNYVELTAERQLKMRDGLLCVRNVEYYYDDRPTVFHVAGATEETQVWNVSDLSNIVSVETSLNGSELVFKADNMSLQEFVVITPSQYEGKSVSPISRSANYTKVSNQNLHSLRDIDMVILSPEAFLAPSQRLAEEHERKDGLTTAVVTDEEVYNEFSSGTPEATAYRMFMKMLYDRALASGGEVRRPRYLLLMGDGSFDNRKLLNSSAYPTLLTYQAANSVNEVEAYATDDYFGFLADDSGGNRDSSDSMCIAVGRLPINTLEEAEQVVTKIIRYMENSSRGKWKTQLCFLSDDGNSGLHTVSSEKAAELVRAEAKDFNINKIYIDAYPQESRATGDSYPLAKSKLDNLMHNGLLFFDYCGHAGYNNLSDEQMLTAKEIRQMSNQNMGFWMLATCNFARFDARTTSAAELAVLNPDGGAIGLLAACRTVFAEQNDVLNKNVCQQLFSRDTISGRFVYTIGEAVKRAKRQTTIDKNGSDKNKLSYILLCDPALRLQYPDEYIVETTHAGDTLRALTVQTVSGYIRTHEGDTATDFNGKLLVSVYDKQQKLSTLDNDQTDTERKVIKNYLDFPNMLFSGETEVKGGKFTFSYMIPKDIRYNFGNGRIVYYAQDTIYGSEAMGYYEDVIIGGSSSVEIVDTVGPELTVYLNNMNFVNGGQTNTQPHFYADIYDEHGINTVGSGLGHDLMLMVDKSQNMTYILNDYFTAAAGSYQQGRVSYKMAELSEGQHSLAFRAWDLLNNSSTATLDFEVVSGLTPEIFSLLVYPNPLPQGGELNLLVDHDRPDAALLTEIYLFDVSGYLVYQKTVRGSIDHIVISQADANLRPGVYFLNVRLKTDDSKYTFRTAKVMVI